MLVYHLHHRFVFILKCIKSDVLYEWESGKYINEEEKMREELKKLVDNDKKDYLKQFHRKVT